MKRAPESLKFFKGICEEEGSLLPRWTNLPSRRPEGGNTFFNTPLFASTRAIQTYGKTILRCLGFLQERASKLNGIHSLQEFCDMTGERPSLVFIEEGDGGDNGVGAVLNDEIPMRVVAMLRFEVHTYYLRYGWEWIGIESLEDSH